MFAAFGKMQTSLTLLSLIAHIQWQREANKSVNQIK